MEAIFVRLITANMSAETKKCVGGGRTPIPRQRIGWLESLSFFHSDIREHKEIRESFSSLCVIQRFSMKEYENTQ